MTCMKNDTKSEQNAMMKTITPFKGTTDCKKLSEWLHQMDRMYEFCKGNIPKFQTYMLSKLTLDAHSIMKAEMKMNGEGWTWEINGKQLLIDNFNQEAGQEGAIQQWTQLKQGNNSLTAHNAEVNRIHDAAGWKEADNVLERRLTYIKSLKDEQLRKDLRGNSSLKSVKDCITEARRLTNINIWATSDTPKEESEVATAKTTPSLQAFPKHQQKNHQDQPSHNPHQAEEKAAAQEQSQQRSQQQQQPRYEPQRSNFNNRPRYSRAPYVEGRWCLYHMSGGHYTKDCESINNDTSCRWCEATFPQGQLLTHSKVCKATKCKICKRFGHDENNCRKNGTANSGGFRPQRKQFHRAGGQNNNYKNPRRAGANAASTANEDDTAPVEPDVKIEQ